MCIPGLYLSLGVFNRLWTLLENSCKELDFSLATDGSSAASFPGAGADVFTKWSNIKIEYRTSEQYKKVVSDLLTYTQLYQLEKLVLILFTRVLWMSLKQLKGGLNIW